MRDTLTVTSVNFTSLSCFCLLSIDSKVRRMRSTPTEMQSMSENDFECFASTGVNTPGTMLPSSSSELLLHVTLSSAMFPLCHTGASNSMASNSALKGSIRASERVLGGLGSHPRLLLSVSGGAWLDVTSEIR
jgi:hypothetical protein